MSSLRNWRDDAALRTLRGLITSLMTAIDDPTVDRVQQQLDSTTLFRCAEGALLLARLHQLRGEHKIGEEWSDSAAKFCEAAERMQGEEVGTDDVGDGP